MRRLAVGMLITFMGAGVAAAAEDPGFTFASGVAEYDEAYQKARKTIAADVRKGKFLAGKNWDQVWTRDTAYSVELGCALLHPDVSKTTLLGLKENVRGIGECWYQDKCGHFGGWPNLTDAIVGAQGTWALYLVTGDKELLRPLFDRTVRSLKRAERDAYDEKTGLFKGCSSFMESNSGYPKKYKQNGKLVGKTCALSTCLLYYQGYQVTARVGELLGEDVAVFKEKAAGLKTAINKHLWLPEKGYYAYFLDENGVPVPQMEGLGEAFAILTGVAGAERARKVLESTPTTSWGTPCLWPQFENWRNYKTHDCLYYHNGMVWPFVQGYWAWAASRMKDVKVFDRELDALVRLSQKQDTYMEFYRPEDGAPDGSPRQLWSASGFVSMVYHGLFGMEFEEDGVRFSPVVPARFKNLELSDVKYRDAVLRIVVKGNGTTIGDFKVDGKPRKTRFFEASNHGAHEIEVRMK